MKNPELLERAAKAVYDEVAARALAGNDGLPWVDITDAYRNSWRNVARAAINAWQEGAPEVKVPVFGTFVAEALADQAIWDAPAPLHRCEMDRGTYVLTPKLEH
jgi:hypothetical protein